MHEFDLISRYFAPLARAGGAWGLEDDVAELAVPEGRRLIVTMDTMVEGVHFLPDDPLETVAQKLVRVNVSDILAKGGQPYAALLALTWPTGRDTGELEGFACGLGGDLSAWNIDLLGGDTTSTPGPLTVSLTLHGLCCARGPVRRSGAQVGDLVWVTGGIGDGGLGLLAAQGVLDLPAEGVARLVEAYRTPDLVSQAMADLVAEHASASMDISDGLVADAGHLAKASGLGVEIDVDAIPLNGDAHDWVNAEGADTLARRLHLSTCGDDYQILFTAPPEASDALKAASAASAASAAGAGRLTCIGRCLSGEGARLLDSASQVINLTQQAGWTHF